MFVAVDKRTPTHLHYSTDVEDYMYVCDTNDGTLERCSIQDYMILSQQEKVYGVHQLGWRYTVDFTPFRWALSSVMRCDEAKVNIEGDVADKIYNFTFRNTVFFKVIKRVKDKELVGILVMFEPHDEPLFLILQTDFKNSVENSFKIHYIERLGKYFRVCLCILGDSTSAAIQYYCARFSAIFTPEGEFIGIEDAECVSQYAKLYIKTEKYDIPNELKAKLNFASPSGFTRRKVE